MRAIYNTRRHMRISLILSKTESYRYYIKREQKSSDPDSLIQNLPSDLRPEVQFRHFTVFRAEQSFNTLVNIITTFSDLAN